MLLSFIFSVEFEEITDWDFESVLAQAVNTTDIDKIMSKDFMVVYERDKWQWPLQHRPNVSVVLVVE
jgi:hypothetical protein